MSATERDLTVTHMVCVGNCKIINFQFFLNMDLVDLPKFVKSINNANDVRKNNKNIVFYLNIRSYNFLLYFVCV